ncbi:hypothetical protein Desor_3601 [Desulfosporosinus orientis DSM 765]|uniref:Lipoprotein n=1 Tax=Desulfosporosinus orientis (strain ATCC 19365 / DSM 765 / NCIMB 8382 / VKM B-1628 / Singapore I) TaxID=768706 RepID=G7WIK7_DESOD|nr:hypothetical protein [Desulfosporosinus orientis]AET69081.1 hypothetical protein Desor_3601 [Desulfosporosinus orientis DSM 765]
MEKPYLGKKLKGRSVIIIGVLLSALVIGVSGCGTKDTQSEVPSSTQQSNTEGQNMQKDGGQRQTLNPAVEAAMSIRRLQANEEVALTSEQKEAVKPILQSLIDTTDPSEDFLKEKGEAIEAVFTEDQKTYLSTNAPQGGNQGDRQNGQPMGEPKDQSQDQGNNEAKDQSQGEKGAPDKNTPPSFQSKDIFQEVLDSLN